MESGARVPADVRLITSAETTVDEASFTGESLPVEKNPLALVAENAPIAERVTMVFAGATILNGRVEGIVVATGLATELGKIAEALADPSAAVPPLISRLRQLARLIGIAAVCVVTILATVESLRGTPIREVLIVTVALAVSVIPEGLPVAITVALSIGRAQMARRDVIIRALPERMACTSPRCSSPV